MSHKVLFALISPLILTATAAAAAPNSQSPLVVAQATPQSFGRGDVLPENYRKRIVKNPYHVGLSRPARGEQWIQVGRTFYLIDATSGVIKDIGGL